MKITSLPLTCLLLLFGLNLSAEDTGDYDSKIIGLVRYVQGGTFKHTKYLNNISTIDSFHMGQFEITGNQYLLVMGIDPSDTNYRSDDTNPVQMVNWYQAIAFCNKLSILENLEPVYSIEGIDFKTIRYADIPQDENKQWDDVKVSWNNNGYRLPTEMEWYWAAMGCRDEINKPYSGGQDIKLIGDYAVYGYYEDRNGWTAGRTSEKRSNPVGSKKPNEIGLYDLSGNIFEWLWDWYADYPKNDLENYVGPDKGTKRIIAGGFWGKEIPFLRIGYREYQKPYKKDFAIGFRVVRK